MTTTKDSLRTNAVFWLIWILPGSAVIAGLATLAIALRDADRALPAAYHWEGERLDADFARARFAADHGIQVTLEVRAPEAQCVATVRNAPANTAALELLLTNTADVALDRSVTLRRVAPGDYRADCERLPAGHWLVALGDDAAQWILRTAIVGAVERIELAGRNPGGPRA